MIICVWMQNHSFTSNFRLHYKHPFQVELAGNFAKAFPAFPFERRGQFLSLFIQKANSKSELELRWEMDWNLGKICSGRCCSTMLSILILSSQMYGRFAQTLVPIGGKEMIKSLFGMQIRPLWCTQQLNPTPMPCHFRSCLLFKEDREHIKHLASVCL